MRLFRVFPWARGVRAGSPGHPLWTPRERQGVGRIDNPDLYAALYATDDAVAAICEAFHQMPVWTSSMLVVPGVPGATRALVTLDTGEGGLLDIDDPRVLLERDLRPSRVVWRERDVTQAWARAAFLERAWAGVSWWSAIDSRWRIVGLWDARATRVRGRIDPLRMDHPALVEAASVLQRPIAA